MDSYTKLETLLDLAEQLGLEIRRARAFDSTEGSGGAVVQLRGKMVIFLDPEASMADQADLLASALAKHAEVGQMYLPPEIRQLIDRADSEAGQS